jgi:hypothetical protein
MKQYNSFILVFIVLVASLNFPCLLIQAAIQTKQKKPQISNNYDLITVNQERIILDTLLQQELQEKILTARAELQNRSRILAINSSNALGIGYFHRGQNNWELRFTFGGIILDTSETIILSTEQIFALKKRFQHTDWLVINGQKYQTTRSMIQFGPILHDQGDFKSRERHLNSIGQIRRRFK